METANFGNIATESRQDPQKAQQEGLTAPSTRLLRKKKGDRDTFVHSTDGHEVGFSQREAVIKHPSDCTFKGSRFDGRKTFHNWSSFLAYVDNCKLNIQQGVMDNLEKKYREVRANAKY